MAPDFLDRYSRGGSLCHRMPARLKILLTLAAILTAALVPISAWPVHGVLATLIFMALSVAGIPLAYLWRRIMLFLPFVLCLGLALSLVNDPLIGWAQARGQSALASNACVLSALAYLAVLFAGAQSGSVMLLALAFPVLNGSSLAILLAGLLRRSSVYGEYSEPRLAGSP